jgi:hypothetical protein
MQEVSLDYFLLVLASPIWQQEISPGVGARAIFCGTVHPLAEALNTIEQ